LELTASVHETVDDKMDHSHWVSCQGSTAEATHDDHKLVEETAKKRLKLLVLENEAVEAVAKAVPPKVPVD